MASGVIKHLALAGYEVIALERPAPTCVRRGVCFAEAVFEERLTIEGVTAVLSNSLEWSPVTAADPIVRVLIDPEATLLSSLAPVVLVDGRMLKQQGNSHLGLAPIVVGLGPGFTAPENCHVVIETNRGPNLGQALNAGSPEAYSGVPAPVLGYSRERVLRSPATGKFEARCQIGETVRKGQVLGQVGSVAVIGTIDGIVRGLIRSGLEVTSGQKIGDIDPRGEKERCYQMSGKANAIGIGVLNALRTMSNQ